MGVCLPSGNDNGLMLSATELTEKDANYAQANICGGPGETN